MRDPQGRAILVSANMYQLGQTDIRTSEMQSKVIDLKTESHVLLGLHKDEFKQDEWERITANPVREARVLLRELGWTANFSKVWGRRYIHKNVQVQDVLHLQWSSIRLSLSQQRASKSWPASHPR